VTAGGDDPRTVFPPRSAAELLELLRSRGATALRRVNLRSNRSTLWSLSEGGRVLNLHRGYAGAPDGVLDDLALLARSTHRPSPAILEAHRRVRDWPPVLEAVARARAQHTDALFRAGEAPVPCAGEAHHRELLRSLYRRLNRDRFRGVLPEIVPLRWSTRMRSRLGHMRPGVDPEGRLRVVEIALNAALLHPANGALLKETLLHEMAHAADYLETGAVGHGPGWQAWALRVGCEPRACTRRPVRGIPRRRKNRKGGRG